MGVAQSVRVTGTTMFLHKFLLFVCTTVPCPPPPHNHISTTLVTKEPTPVSAMAPHQLFILPHHPTEQLFMLPHHPTEQLFILPHHPIEHHNHTKHNQL